jgi:hypothetical protein
MGGMNRRRTVPLPVVVLVVATLACVLALPSLSSAATITGMVLNEEDPGVPLGGVLVIVFQRAGASFTEVGRMAGRTSATGPDAGVYRVDGIPTGSYILAYNPRRYPDPPGDGEGYFSDQYSGAHSRIDLVSVSDEVTVGAEPTVTVPVVHLQPSPTFVFRVRRLSADGLPVPFANVTGFFKNEVGGFSDFTFSMATSGDSTSTSRPSGEWRFRVNVPGNWHGAGLYAIDSTATAYWPSDGTSYITVPAGTTETITLLVSKLPSATPVPDALYWQQGDVTVSVTQEDGDRTPTVWHRRITRNDWVLPPVVSEIETDGPISPVVLSVEGAYTIEAWGEDGWSRKGPVNYASAGIDRTPPHTESNAGGISQSTLVLAATDNLVGTRDTLYTLDGSAPQTYAEPVPLTPGAHSVSWWSVDYAENTETVHAGTIYGGLPNSVRRPVSRSTITHGRNLSVSGTLSRARNHSRVTLIAYKLVGSEWVQARTKSVKIHTPRRGLSRYSGSIKISSKGRWRIVTRYEGDTKWLPSFSSPRYVKAR